MKIKKSVWRCLNIIRIIRMGTPQTQANAQRPFVIMVIMLSNCRFAFFFYFHLMSPLLLPVGQGGSRRRMALLMLCRRRMAFVVVPQAHGLGLHLPPVDQSRCRRRRPLFFFGFAFDFFDYFAI